MLKNTTLALFDFNARQQAAFTAILVLSEMSLNDTWNIVDKEVASIIFVCSPPNITQEQWNKIQLSHPNALLIAYGINSKNLDVNWKLLTDTDKPPQRSLLISLLDQVAIKLRTVTPPSVDKSDATSTPKPEIIPKPEQASKKKIEDKVIKKVAPKQPFQNNANEYECFVPKDYFLGIIQKCIQTGEIYHCQTTCNIDIFLYPQQKSYFCQLKISELTRLFLMSPEDIDVKIISETILNQSVKKIGRMPLNDLLWYSTIIPSQGRLMENHKNNNIVNLKFWPDISYITTSKNYLAITSFMNRNAVDLNKIADHTEKKLTDVINFHNACDMLGLIDHSQQLTIKSTPASDKLRQLRQCIFDTLSLNTAN
ncbi:MAG: hypothetical protein Q9M50_15205 [Methylococcales bacterium]|nr:hypothetical protein [Methylococcales bacterium]